MTISPTPRTSGILLHPSSLAGPYGIGDLGPGAYAWIDSLARARQKWWQILPLGPTGYGDSPYQCFSAFGGNINLLSPELLIRDGLIRPTDVAGHLFPEERVAYEKVIPFKSGMVRLAWDHYRAGQAASLREPFESFCNERKSWLDDYALFMALKDARRGESWHSWPPELLRREGSLRFLDFTRQELMEEVGYYQFGQFLFFRQWSALKDYAHARNVRLIGDVPIFVSPDSADIWANPKLFLLDGALRPKVVAGVPPDYFSPTGQLWGNPLYDWGAMKAAGYQWWIQRLRATLELVDLIRLDHFRGFCAAWHIPAGEPNAIKGHWVKGPGSDLFIHLKSALATLPLIAEDLGEITPDVHQLRDDFELPGMKVLQFAFDGPYNPFLPHNYQNTHWVAYSGTHDNDTSAGWYATLPEHPKGLLKRYLGRDSGDISWDLLRMAWSSVAAWAIAPLQDVLSLGTEARMNWPGRADGNWQWRLPQGAFTEQHIGKLADLTELYAR
jgi:4-alpha-glucanotransferase